MRICSLLSSATEIIYALGLVDELVAVTNRCDYPLEAGKKPIASRDIISSDLPSEEIDRVVQECIRAGQSTHILDEEVIRAAKPDLVITQDLCNVCDIGSSEVIAAFRNLRPRPEFLILSPKTLWEFLDNVRRVGRAAGVAERAEQIVEGLIHRMRRVAEPTMLASRRPRVFCMEWMNPPIAGGHWMPEMVWLAGGVDGLGHHGLTGVRRSWKEIAAYQPEVVVVQPCGLDIHRTLREVGCLDELPEWQELPAVQNNQVYVVDPVYYTRPGPRLVTGIEILAEIMHPECFQGLIPSGAMTKLELGRDQHRAIGQRSQPAVTPLDRR